MSALLARLVARVVNIGEHDDKGSHDKRVDNLARDESVPDAAESTLGVDEIPLDPLLIINELAVLIDIVGNVINHHFLQVGFSHFLEPRLEAELVGVAARSSPKCLGTVASLLLVHVFPVGFLSFLIRVRRVLAEAAA